MNKKVKNPDPLSNPKTMGREGMKIIRNIAYGKFNFYTEGHIFRNEAFVNATIHEVDKRLLDVAIHVKAMEYAYSGSIDAAVLRLLHQDRKSYEAYTLIRRQLYAILESGDTGFLLVLVNKLPLYKYNI